jgi:hypothetical protein
VEGFAGHSRIKQKSSQAPASQNNSEIMLRRDLINDGSISRKYVQQPFHFLRTGNRAIAVADAGPDPDWLISGGESGGGARPVKP